MPTPSDHTGADNNDGDGIPSPIGLPEGTRLRNQYRIDGVLGAGRFGITYRAHDERLDTDVAIKEYYPRHLAGRTRTTLTLEPHRPENRDDFAFGRKRFMEEGRTLARFDHPNIVRVRSYFEAHRTGYLVMDYYEGTTLAQYLAGQGGTLPEDEVVQITRDVLRGLEPVHREDLLHRDIDPHNIYRTEEGRVVLLDFGAARLATEERSEGDRVVVTPGYAPPEQYFRDGDQGPWTDVYASAATLYKCLTGITPPEARARLKEDRLTPPHEVISGGSLDVSAAVMKGMTLDIERRPGTVDEFFSLLPEPATRQVSGKGTARDVSLPEAPTEQLPASESEDGSTPFPSLSFRGVLLGGVVLLTIVAAAWFFLGDSIRSSDPRPRARSIAVLPFDTVGEEETGQFARGIHEDVLTRLSNVSDLQVISRTSVMQYQNSGRPLPDIARELGVQWVLEGSVQEAGGQVRVTAQLIDAENDTHAWAENYQRELTPKNLFAIQNELAEKITGSLEATLTADEEDRIRRRPTENLEAYRLYVRGRALLDQRSDQGIQRAVEYFRRALDRDSSYALAWAGLADAHSLLSLYGYAPADSALSNAFEAANRAVTLDPTRAEAHASLGLVHDYRRNGPAAVHAYERALELNPNYARAHQWLGNLYLALGRREQARVHLQTASELDPMSPSIHAALAGVYNRERPPHTQEALAHTGRAKELAPEYAAAHFVEGVALTRAGRYDEALQALARGVDLAAPDDGVRQLHLGKPAVTHLRRGDTTRARSLLRELQEDDESPYARAEVHTALGETEEAFALLETVEWAKFLAAELRFSPALDPLREDPRFKQLLRDVNHLWGLDPDGSLPTAADSVGDAS